MKWHLQLATEKFHLVIICALSQYVIILWHFVIICTTQEMLTGWSWEKVSLAATATSISSRKPGSRITSPSYKPLSLGEVQPHLEQEIPICGSYLPQPVAPLFCLCGHLTIYRFAGSLTNYFASNWSISELITQLPDLIAWIISYISRPKRNSKG